MDVQDGQLAGAPAVLEAAYIGKLPDAVARDPGLLLQVLVVADRFEFEGCIAAVATAVAAALEPTPGPGADGAPGPAGQQQQQQAPLGGAAGAAAPQDGRSWSMAVALVKLPESLLRQRAMERAAEAALSRIIAPCSDLEAAWQERELRRTFASLPAEVVRAVLGQPGLKVGTTLWTPASSTRAPFDTTCLCCCPQRDVHVSGGRCRSRGAASPLAGRVLL